MLVFGALAMDVASFGYCPRLRSTAQGYLAFESDLLFFISFGWNDSPWLLSAYVLAFEREAPLPTLGRLFVFVGIKSLSRGPFG